jgi:SAM-dependent methyltransferase
MDEALGQQWGDFRGGRMGHRVCPWWLGYVLASPLRRLLQDPAAVVKPYVREGMTVLEPGPGMGFFTLEMARQVGASGRVVAIDIQPRMIAGLKRRLAKARLLERTEARLAPSDSLGLQDLRGKVDFALAMAVVHEMPSSSRFFAEVAQAMKPGATLLLAEPSGHVKPAAFEAELQDAAAAGLEVADRPAIRRSQAALLKKPGN